MIDIEIYIQDILCKTFRRDQNLYIGYYIDYNLYIGYRLGYRLDIYIYRTIQDIDQNLYIGYIDQNLYIGYPL